MSNNFTDDSCDNAHDNSSSDCGAQENYDSARADYDAAQENYENCKTDFDVAANNLAETEAAKEQAAEKLALALENKKLMEERLELTQKAFDSANSLLEETIQENEQVLNSTAHLKDTAQTRLVNAAQTLEDYLQHNPEAKSFSNWLNWTPEVSQKITPDIISSRFKLAETEQAYFQKYLYERNSKYKELADRFASEYKNSRSNLELNNTSRKIRSNLAGSYGERLAQYALAPLGKNIETERRTIVGDSATFTDISISSLKNPIILGRGDNMGARVGGTMAFEIKTGKPEYLYSEKEHMVFQAKGHKHADARAVLCSKDIHNLPQEKQDELRRTLREAGSALIAVLPTKQEIDKSCISFIKDLVASQS